MEIKKDSVAMHSQKKLIGGTLMNEKSNQVEAFILMNRQVLAANKQPDKNIYYNNELQLWVNQENGEPIVLQNIKSNADEKLCSDFGETIFTKTQEGADQSEVVGFSEFGETAITETREGADQSEIIGFSDFGETRFTATREGSDQTEISCLPSADFISQ